MHWKALFRWPAFLVVMTPVGILNEEIEKLIEGHRVTFIKED